MAKKLKVKNATPRERLIDLLNQEGQTFESLCDDMNLPPKALRAMLEDLESGGVAINVHDDFYSIAQDTRMGPQDTEHDHKLPSGLHRIGLLSDTHLGSHNQQLTYLHEFYKRAIDMGVNKFYHAGDVCAGDGFVYKGQINEIFAHGLDHNIAYVNEHYPKHQGVTTYFITGNHDFAWYQRGGADIGHFISKARKDMVYLGQGGAYARFTDKVRLYLHHPDSGVGYSIDYKPRRFVERLTEEQRPEIMVWGHLHQMVWFDTSGVDVFLPGCFESQNTWLKRKGLHPVIGGNVIEFFLENNEVRELSLKRIRWDTPIVKDF